MPFRNEEFINKNIKEFLEELVNVYTAIIEVWLFGSRVQEGENANDWDLLVVTLDRGKTLSIMENNIKLRKEAEKLQIHLFVHGKDTDVLGDYYCPWKRKDSNARDKINIREKFTWPDPFEFQYTGEDGENFAKCIWDKEGGSDSFLSSNYLIQR